MKTETDSDDFCNKRKRLTKCCCNNGVVVCNEVCKMEEEKSFEKITERTRQNSFYIENNTTKSSEETIFNAEFMVSYTGEKTVNEENKVSNPIEDKKNIIENKERRDIFLAKPFYNQWTHYRLKTTIDIQKSKKLAFKRSFTMPTQKIDFNEKSNFTDFWKNIDNGVKCTLPTVSYGRCDSIPRISGSVMNGILKKKYHIKYKIIDCRFDYEYEGGHIKDSINIDNINLLEKSMAFFKDHILIFYCEFSSVRAPRTAKYLRNYDRFSNEYPKLDFPEIYVLDGGYKKFFRKYVENCYPQKYIQMNCKK